MIKLDTPKQRLLFAVAFLWFAAWTVAYILSGIYTPYGFKPGGWFMFAVLPIIVVYCFLRAARWIRSGS